MYVCTYSIVQYNTIQMNTQVCSYVVKWKKRSALEGGSLDFEFSLGVIGKFFDENSPLASLFFSI